MLAQRFNAGFEQVCHRLTTLQRPNARGVPFFLLRVDNAGNVSKRFSSGTFPFSKFGGTCPLWNVHSTFDTPDRLLKQVIELPDGTRYFSIAQMVRRPVAPHPQPQPRFAIGLGCEIRHASKLVYAAGMDLEKAEGTPIGVNCRLCERENCSQRAEPPITRTLILDENTRRVSSFAFSQCEGVVRPFCTALTSIRQRERIAPAVLADLALDHLAAIRPLKQRAQAAAIDALRRVLIFGLLPGHFVRSLRSRGPKQKRCRCAHNDKAHDLAPRCIHLLFSHVFSHGVILQFLRHAPLQLS